MAYRPGGRGGKATEPLSGILWGQNYLHKNTKILFVFFTMLTFALNTVKAMVDKTADIWAQIKAMSGTKYTGIKFFTAIHWQLKKKPVLFNVLDETVKITFTKSQPMSTCLFNIVCDHVGIVQTALLPT